MKSSTGSHPRQRFSQLSGNLLLVIFIIALIGISVLSLSMGAFKIDLFGENAEMSRRVFFKLRLPRVLAGIIAGGVLGVTGAVTQTVFCNPLATPDITGVASGASFGAAVAILLGYYSWSRIASAFVGGVIALILLLIFVRLSSRAGAEEKGRYILSGILISSAFDAGLMVLKTVADPERELAAIEFWIMGSFASMTSEKLIVMALSSLPPLALLFLFSRQALILSRGADEARSVGVSPKIWQAVLLLLSTLAVAGVVSCVGVIGFVGLIVPHMALAVSKKRGFTHLLLCFVIGAIITVISDLLARMLFEGAELPVSFFCIAFAILWFAVLFCRGKVMGGER